MDYCMRGTLIFLRICFESWRHTILMEALNWMTSWMPSFDGSTLRCFKYWMPSTRLTKSIWNVSVRRWKNLNPLETFLRNLRSKSGDPSSPPGLLSSQWMELLKSWQESQTCLHLQNVLQLCLSSLLVHHVFQEQEVLVSVHLSVHLLWLVVWLLTQNWMKSGISLLMHCYFCWFVWKQVSTLNQLSIPLTSRSQRPSWTSKRMESQSLKSYLISVENLGLERDLPGKEVRGEEVLSLLTT